MLWIWTLPQLRQQASRFDGELSGLPLAVLSVLRALPGLQ
jgi:hypothetical protein